MEKPEALNQTIISLDQSVNRQNKIIINKRFQCPQEERFDIIAIPGKIEAVELTKPNNHQISTYYAICLGKYSIESINQLNTDRNDNYITYQPEFDVGIGLSDVYEKINDTTKPHSIKSQLTNNLNTLKKYYESNHINPEKDLEFLIIYSALNKEKLNIMSDITINFLARKIHNQNNLFLPGLEFNFSHLNKKSLSETKLINRNYFIKINHPLIKEVLEEFSQFSNKNQNFILGINDFRFNTLNQDYLLNLKPFFKAILINQNKLKNEIKKHQTTATIKPAIWQFFNSLSSQTLKIN